MPMSMPMLRCRCRDFQMAGMKMKFLGSTSIELRDTLFLQEAIKSDD